MKKKPGLRYILDDVPKNEYLLSHALYTPHIGASTEKAEKAVVAATKEVLVPVYTELSAPPPALKLLSSKATSDLLPVLAGKSLEQLLQPVDVESVGADIVSDRIKAGEAIDMVVGAAEALDGLEKFLIPGSRVNLVKSKISAAVRTKTRHYDISSVEALKVAVRSADKIAYSTSASGKYLIKLLERWGMYEEIKPKLVKAESGESIGSMLAKGKADFGLQQTSEIKKVEKEGGIDVLGELPLSEFPDSLTVFAGAIPKTSRNPEGRDACAETHDF